MDETYTLSENGCYSWNIGGVYSSEVETLHKLGLASQASVLI